MSLTSSNARGAPAQLPTLTASQLRRSAPAPDSPLPIGLAGQTSSAFASAKESAPALLSSSSAANSHAIGSTISAPSTAIVPVQMTGTGYTTAAQLLASVSESAFVSAAPLLPLTQQQIVTIDLLQQQAKTRIQHKVPHRFVPAMRAMTSGGINNTQHTASHSKLHRHTRLSGSQSHQVSPLHHSTHRLTVAEQKQQQQQDDQALNKSFSEDEQQQHAHHAQHAHFSPDEDERQSHQTTQQQLQQQQTFVTEPPHSQSQQQQQQQQQQSDAAKKQKHLSRYAHLLDALPGGGGNNHNNNHDSNTKHSSHHSTHHHTSSGVRMSKTRSSLLGTGGVATLLHRTLSTSPSRLSHSPELRHGQQYTIANRAYPLLSLDDYGGEYTTTKGALTLWPSTHATQAVPSQANKPLALIELEAHIERELQAIDQNEQAERQANEMSHFAAHGDSHNNNQNIEDGRSDASTVQREEQAEIDAATMNANQLDSRLQVYKEAFYILSTHFTTYRPLLLRIKSEYDAALERAAEELRLVPMIRSQLATIEHQQRKATRQQQRIFDKHQAQMQQLCDSQLSEIQHLTAQVQQFEHQVTVQQTRQHQLEAEITDYQKTSLTLTDALRRHNSEKVSRENLVNDSYKYNSQLKGQLNELQKSYDNLFQEMTLLSAESASRIAPDEHARVQVDLEHTKSECAAQRSLAQQKTQELHLLMQQVSDAHTDTEKIRQEKQQLEAIRLSSTPRPDWRRLMSEGFLHEKTKLTEHSSQTLVQNLCTEITRLKSIQKQWEDKYGADELVTQNRKDESANLDPHAPAGAGVGSQLNSKTADGSGGDSAAGGGGEPAKVSKWIKCLGDGDEVPRFLRQKGRIRNKNISKRETELFIKELWKQKYKSPESAEQLLQDYMYVFLKKKFALEALIVEMGYNYMNALQRYQYDADCDLFLQIIEGKISERVFSDQNELIDELKSKFIELDQVTHKGTMKHHLTRKQVLELLKRFFTFKNVQQMKLINRSLHESDAHAEIDYDALFSEDREGNQCPFIECVRDQHLQEFFDYQSEIKAGISEMTFRGLVKPVDIRAVFAALDPMKSQADCDAFIRAGAGLKENEPIDDQSEIKCDNFFEAMHHCFFKRSGAKPEQVVELVPERIKIAQAAVAEAEALAAVQAAGGGGNGSGGASNAQDDAKQRAIKNALAPQNQFTPSTKQQPQMMTYANMLLQARKQQKDKELAAQQAQQQQQAAAANTANASSAQSSAQPSKPVTPLPASMPLNLASAARIQMVRQIDEPKTRVEEPPESDED